MLKRDPAQVPDIGRGTGHAFGAGMKPHPPSHGRHGFTLTEFIVVVVVSVLGLLLWPTISRPKVCSKRIACVNNLKQVGLAFRLWSGDNNDRFPMAVPVNQGGTMWTTQFHQAWMHYLVMSNELSIPKVLRCPMDEERVAAAAFDPTFGNQNVSYFVGLEADETKPQMILSGDRNLTFKGKQLSTGTFEFKGTNDIKASGWSKTLHNRQGNLLFADGSVQQVAKVRLREALLESGTNRFVIP